MGKRLDITGVRYGRLVAVALTADGDWLCKCDCGRETRKSAGGLRGGHVRSCGCRKNGLSSHPLYWRWAGMIARCTNPNHVGYKNYGGRGVTVCDHWLTFENFMTDMGEPAPGQTLERRENSKGYQKDNCFWASAAEQSRNTRRNVWITLDGVRLTIRDWEHRIGVKRGVIQRRLDLGWPPEQAVSEPIQPGKALRRRSCL